MLPEEVIDYWMIHYSLAVASSLLKESFLWQTLNNQ